MILIAHGGWMANNSFLKKNSEEKKKFTRVFFSRGENICIVLYVYFGIIALIYILEFSNHIDIYEKNKISIA